METQVPATETPEKSINPVKPLRPANRFQRTLQRHGVAPLERGEVSVLQINVGKRCNQACKHCHVEAGPKRTEVMEAPMVERMIKLASLPRITTVDITGGAPEMNPHFRRLVEGVTSLGIEVIVRCNLTIVEEPGYHWLPDFYALHGVRLVSSLPCYTLENVEAQRGKGVFGKSIAALQSLNARGYGLPDSGLQLDLVYNPLGPILPGDQAALEADYKRVLRKEFGIEFHHLLSMANLPIGRFSQALAIKGEHAAYLQLLENAFNPDTVPHLMCRNTLSVGWDGRLYDCDFNQMLEMELSQESEEAAPALFDEAFRLESLRGRPIRTGAHCLGCTAGTGSSCGGALS